jgi:hypothetical protein
VTRAPPRQPVSGFFSNLLRKIARGDRLHFHLEDFRKSTGYVMRDFLDAVASSRLVLDGSHLHGVDAAGYDEIEVGA